MAITEEEKRTIRAYNIGYALSTYEPRLLAKLIKSNPNNEFVKAMATGRDHHEFHANIPKKYSREFKNGYYNGRILAENSPEMLERLMQSKTVKTDFKNGLAAANKEYSVKLVKDKIKQENIKKDFAKRTDMPKWLAKKDQTKPAPKEGKSKDKGFEK